MRQIWTERPFMNKQKRYAVTRVRKSAKYSLKPDSPWYIMCNVLQGGECMGLEAIS